MSIEEYRYMNCAECGELVFAPVSEDNDWICNRCDYKANPEDYADFSYEELVSNGLIDEPPESEDGNT